MNENVMSLIFLVVLIILMYLTLIRPQKKKQKEADSMRSQLQVGDEVVTIGGFVGKVVKTKEDSVIIQVNGDKTKLEIMKWGISKVVEKASGRSVIDDNDDEVAKKPSRPNRLKKAEKTEEAEETVESPVEEKAEVEE